MIDLYTLRALQEVEQAKRTVERFVGAMDGVYESPGEVYRKALKRLGHDTKALREFDDTNAAEAAFMALPGNKKVSQRRMAADSATTTRLKEMFPNYDRLGRV